MKKINLAEATKFTSPNPLTLVCTNKPDGTTNVAPVSFVSYLSFSPAMLGFAMGKGSYSGQRMRETGKAVVTVPSLSLAETVMGCGSTSGQDVDKVEKFGIELTEINGSDVKIPADTKLAFVVTLDKAVEIGDHYLYICNIDGIYGDEEKEGLFAWNGYAKVAPAAEK